MRLEPGTFMLFAEFHLNSLHRKVFQNLFDRFPAFIHLIFPMMSNPTDQFPLSNFPFHIDISDHLKNVPFSTVMGMEVEPGEYQSGKTPTTKMPGQQPEITVTLLRGISSNSGTMIRLQSEISSGTFAPREMAIRLSNESGEAVMFWTLKEAKITRLMTGVVSAASGEIEINELVISCSGINNSTA